MADEAREGDRVAKLLARAGVASRREIERMIADGRVAVDGKAIETPATLLTSLRGVTVDGKPVAKPERTRLFVFHKPAGLLTAERDFSGRPTIYDALRNALPAEAPRVMPVGRLDLNTEGLLLLTNDGEVKRLLELPATGVPRSYRARTFGEVSQAQLEDLFDGITIEGVRYGPIDANLERRTGRNQWVELTLTEGKNREVRRVLEHLGLKVSRLIRVAYGPFVLGDLPRGGVFEVRNEDLQRFLGALKNGDGEALVPVQGETRMAARRPQRSAAKIPAAAPREKAPSRPPGRAAKAKPPVRGEDVRHPGKAVRKVSAPRGERTSAGRTEAGVGTPKASGSRRGWAKPKPRPPRGRGR